MEFFFPSLVAFFTLQYNFFSLGVLLGQPHIQDDENTDIETMKSYEKLLNGHCGMWTRMLRAGEKTHSEDRIRHSMMSKNNTAAPLSLLRKDHKQYESEMIGPPG